MTIKAKLGQHMSLRDLADILAIITKEPMTARMVSCKHKLGLTHMRRVLRNFVSMGIARVVGWDTGIRGTPPAVFAGGAGESLPPPLTKDGVPPKTAWGTGSRVRPNAQTVLFCEFVKALAAGGTIAELAEQTGCCAGTAARLANHMRSLGLARVCAWDAPESGYAARVFKLGSGRDATRPKAMCKREKSLRQYHARKARELQVGMIQTVSGAIRAEVSA